ncbi:MAG: RNA polymerase sigma factor [Verrucomicrobiota bacterium]
MQRDSDLPQLGEAGGQFVPTRWSVVLGARDHTSAHAHGALETLCRTYWYPLYAYLRRQGHESHSAEDLVQAFFERFIQRDVLRHVQQGKGRFRSFLLASLNHFAADEWDRARRLKRGGGSDNIISFDAQTAEDRYRLEPADRLDAAVLYDRRWAMTVIEQALNRLEAEVPPERKCEWVTLRPFLLGEKEGQTYAQAATELGLSEAAVKMAVSRARQRCRMLIREEIAQTVATVAEIDEEYQTLLSALRS